MKNYLFDIVLIFSFLVFSGDLKAQDYQVVIRNTEIITPEVIDLGQIDLSKPQYWKIVIQNKRKNDVQVVNIEAPKGIGVNLKTRNFKPNSQTELLIGLNPEFFEVKDSTFNFSVLIYTNLILPIELNFKGKIKK